MEWTFLAIGGFLLGAFFYTGYYTTIYEPEVKPGYLLLGAGILMSVAINAWYDLAHHVTTWFQVLTLLSYALVTAGLIVVARRRYVTLKNKMRRRRT